MARALAMHQTPRLGAGDPAAFPGGRRDAPVEGGGELERDPGPVLGLAQEETRVILRRLGGEDPEVDGNPGIPQGLEPRARHARVAVLDRRHDARHSGGDQRIGAGRGLAVVRTGFERDVGGRPTRRVTGLGQRLRFRMRPPSRRRMAAPDDAAVLDDDAAHRRIGPGPPHAAAAQAQRMGHVAGVVEGHFSGTASGRNSLTNLSKSSASWKFL